MSVQEAASRPSSEMERPRDLLALVPEDATIQELLALHRGVEERLRRYEYELTVLHLDVVGSTLLKRGAPQVDIEHTFRDLQSYLYQIIESRAVIAYQWAGDGLVCLFENAESAVEAALVIQAGLARFNVEDNRLAEDIQVRIGVHTGVLLYNGHGTIGEMRSETLDVAGHLQKDAEAGRVVITEATYGRLNRDRLKARFQPAGVSRDGHTIYCR